MVLNVHRNHKAYVLWDGEKGGEERLYTYRYTITTRVTPALRWTAMRAILYVSLIVRDKVTGQCPPTTTSEEK